MHTSSARLLPFRRTDEGDFWNIAHLSPSHARATRYRMPKKPVGILKRNAHNDRSTSGDQNRKKRTRQSTTTQAAAAVPETVIARLEVTQQPPQQQQQQQQQQQVWTCQSEVDRQAAACLGKVLSADISKRNGKTIKSLTLAPHIKAKKAVYAVTCQTLQRKLQMSAAMQCSSVHQHYSHKHAPKLEMLQTSQSFNSCWTKQTC